MMLPSEILLRKAICLLPSFFRHNENYRLEDLLILPITSKEVIGRGGSATLYKIELHPYYDKLYQAADRTTASLSPLSIIPG